MNSGGSRLLLSRITRPVASQSRETLVDYSLNPASDAVVGPDRSDILVMDEFVVDETVMTPRRHRTSLEDSTMEDILATPVFEVEEEIEMDSRNSKGEEVGLSNPVI